MSDTIELLPCPWCGSKKIYLDELILEEGACSCFCTECGAAAPMPDYRTNSRSPRDAREAAEFWNRRVDSSRKTDLSPFAPTTDPVESTSLAHFLNQQFPTDRSDASVLTMRDAQAIQFWIDCKLKGVYS